jgi:hypothetical protein
LGENTHPLASKQANSGAIRTRTRPRRSLEPRCTRGGSCAAPRR